MKIKVFILKKKNSKNASNSTLKKLKVSFQLLSSFSRKSCVWRIWHVPDIDNHDTTCSTSPTAANTQATGLNLFIIDRQPFINFFNLLFITLFERKVEIYWNLKIEKLRNTEVWLKKCRILPRTTQQLVGWCCLVYWSFSNWKILSLIIFPFYCSITITQSFLFHFDFFENSICWWENIFLFEFDWDISKFHQSLCVMRRVKSWAELLI